MFGHRNLDFVNNWKYVPVKERRKILREVDDLHRKGAPWPKMPFGRGGALVPFTPLVMPEEMRKPTPRPDHLPYCVYWSGAYWRPCRSTKERTDGGYVGLMMCWPPPVPKTGNYILSGDRARYAYRIAEVERFEKPRTAKRYTFRLWCERVAPECVPESAVLHPFYWHPRKRAA